MLSAYDKWLLCDLPEQQVAGFDDPGPSDTERDWVSLTTEADSLPAEEPNPLPAEYEERIAAYVQRGAVAVPGHETYSHIIRDAQARGVPTEACNHRLAVHLVAAQRAQEGACA